MSSGRKVLAPGIVIPVLSSAPSSPEDGLAYIDAGSDLLRSWDADSSTWREYAPSSGIAGQGPMWIPEGFGVTGSGSPTANMLYASRVKIMGTDSITGIEFRPINTTGSVKPVLFDSSGTQVAIGSGVTLAGSGFGVKQQLAFSSAYTPTPGVYYLGLAFNNASSTYTTIGVVPRGGTKSSAYTTPGNLSSVPSDALSTPPLMWTY